MNVDEAAERELQARRILANRRKLAAGTEWDFDDLTLCSTAHSAISPRVQRKEPVDLNEAIGRDGSCTLPSRLRMLSVAMVVVMVVMVMTMSPDHDHRRSTPMAVVVMMVMMVILGELDIGVRRNGCALVHDPQDRGSVRDRFQQFRVGIDL
ncbi:hypothetical protein JQ615_31075 [Bradyrhizobium jicamae]|uniref:Uncharacterized protein n=1 Tax=Bradyrhizobium jicamae TaxID=280332 RepID=A0ABS5FSL7_9BRAD|nr:hypothetical protein [Bradyrhizobium jicamae]MBR0799822.1 hypothetical protein [Bradyrhizobium jicamae]